MKSFWEGLGVVAVVLMTIGASPVDLDHEGYAFPLVDHFTVMKSFDDHWSLNSERSSIDDLKSLGVSAHFVVGTCDQRYFIVQQDSEPRYFKDVNRWLEARRAIGVADAIALRTPDEIAATFSDRVLHPFNYHIMHGMLGWRDGEWGRTLILGGLILIFLRAIFIQSSATLEAEAVVLALITAYIGGIILDGIDSGAFVGFIGFPLLYLVGAKIGKGLGESIHQRRATSPLAAKQPEVPPA